MSDRYVIVHRTSDPIQAELLGELMHNNGIAVRVLGIRYGASVGVGQYLLPMRIEVPESQAGLATDFLEAYFEQDGEALLAAHGDWEEGESDDTSAQATGPDLSQAPTASVSAAPRSSGTSSFWAAISALFPFGGSHFYARRPGTAVCLLAGQLIAFATLFTLCTETNLQGIVMSLALVGIDIIGGQQAVHASRHRHRSSWSHQVLLGTLFVAAAGTVSVIVASAFAPANSEAPALLSTQQPACR